MLYEDSSEEDESIYNSFYDESPDDIIDICNNKPEYVWELADTITFDVQDLKASDVDLVLSYIFNNQQQSGFYRVNLIYNGKLIDTHMRVEQINMEEANNVVISLLRKEVA